MTTIAPSRRRVRAIGDGFTRVLHAEWTKLRSVRSWIVSAAVVAVVMVLFSWLIASGNHASICQSGPSGHVSCGGEPPVPVGPDGEAVIDTYSYLHEPIVGNGSVTVRVSSLAGVISTAGNRVRAGTDVLAQGKPGLAPWAKAGILITPSLTSRSPYTAVMATGDHGVRMQDNYLHDAAGLPGAVSSTTPRWLRLTRSDDVLTGSDSADGVHWTTIRTTHLSGLTNTLQVGLFVTSPVVPTSLQSNEGTYATATFNHLDVIGAPAGTRLRNTNVGTGPTSTSIAPGRYRRTGSQYVVGGSGDIAPLAYGAGGGGASPDAGLLGVFVALIVVAIVGGRFMTSEYRRAMIRTTFAATPDRSKVLAAKAVVVGVATFAVGLVGAVAAFAVSRHFLRTNGNALLPISTATEIRVVVGTAAMVALTSILAVAVGAVTRRGGAAVVLVSAMTALPLFVALTVSGTAGLWLLRVTPAAGFAIQQSLVHYPQVSDSYTPMNGYFPLSPWVGFAVLCGWTIVALAAAVACLARRDA
jgi:ABC-type transport system involved in multi-copper enzyme maturation permease subunit